MSDRWPQALHRIDGQFGAAKMDGAAEGMGDHGPATRRLIADGYVPPDLITGMTLYLLARQPRPQRQASETRTEKATPIAGGVWVREQFTIHRPLSASDTFRVTGESTGRYVKKGRRYGTTSSSTSDGSGHLVATNLTTGLLSYKVIDGEADSVEGLPLEDTPAPTLDGSVAENNPHTDTIAASTVGERFGGLPMTVALSMMAARDTDNPDNPIHSDAEAAKKAGLSRPIAGGSHVLAFAIEPLLFAWGVGALSHGTHFDVRWKAPTEADVGIVPTATIAEVSADRVVVDLQVKLDDDRVAMVGTVTVPLEATPIEPAPSDR